MKEKKYGLALAISMIVGSVIGSGIFFKSDEVLIKVNGDFKLGIFAWCIGATAMIFGGLVIAEYASRVSNANGMVDYFEYTFSKINEKTGKLFGYLVGWYSALIHYPGIAAVVSWVAAMYTAVLFGKEDPANGMFTWIVALVYLISIFLIATFSRTLSNYIQISSTVLKLIPLFLVAIVGVIVGLGNEVNFTAVTSTFEGTSPSFTGAVIATAFAFDGWILGTTINDELKNSKRDLPRALLIGTFLIFVIYILYFTGIVATVGVDAVITNGDKAASMAFEQLFGKGAATILTVFIIVSCLGTANGLCMASSKVAYQIAKRGHGIIPSTVSIINKRTNTSILSSLVGLLTTLGMLTIWFSNFNPDILFHKVIDISSIPIVINYMFFTILYISAIVQFKDLNIFKRVVIPVCAIAGSSIVIYGGMIDESIGIYMIISIIVILLGIPFFRPNANLD